MKLETVVAVGQSADAVRASAEAFLEARGYGRTATDFLRGSLWGTLSGIDPRKWKARVSMKMLSTGHCGLSFDVNTTGHIGILPSERKFWDDELEAVASVLRGEAAPTLDALDETTKAAGWRTVRVVVGAATAVAMASAIVQVMAAKTGVMLPSGFVGIGAACGALVGLAIAAKPRAPRS